MNKEYNTESSIMVLFTVTVLALVALGYAFVLSQPCERLNKLPVSVVRAECLIGGKK